ncbi:hypothetical protein GE21DRAFT_1097051 [Neurospora crassa]|nr:hypothetical protein GE21DRAFT_1097051 [Neurospora crassa]
MGGNITAFAWRIGLGSGCMAARSAFGLKILSKNEKALWLWEKDTSYVYLTCIPLASTSLSEKSIVKHPPTFPYPFLKKKKSN